MTRYKCLIFDLDGTMANTLEDIYLAWKFSCTTLGLPVIPRERVKQFIGPAREVYLPGLLGDKVGEYGDRALKLYSDYYTEHCTDNTPLYPGIPELLATLYPQYTLTAASNKPSPLVRRILGNLGIESFFKHVYGPDLVARGKPAPDMFLAIAGKENLRPADCLAIGDTFNDLQAGAAAGMDVAAVLWGFGGEKALRELNPKYVAATAGALRDILPG
jgi:phosphoglycolate phosphatase